MKLKPNTMSKALLISYLFLAMPAQSLDWLIGPSMPTPRSEFQVALAQDKLYVAGGIAKFRTTNRCEVFDIKNNVWGTCPKLPKALHHVALTTVNGVVHAGGGYTNLLFGFLESPPLWALNTDAGIWETTGQFPFAVGEHALVGVGADLYLVGGRKKSGTSDELWRLRNGTWQPLANMNTARDSFAMVKTDTELWAIGGRNNEEGALGSVEAYDILLNEWSELPPLPYKAGGLAAVYIADEVHVFGGESLVKGIVYDRHLRFDKATNTWVEETPPGQPRHGLAAISVSNKAYLLGGGSQAGLRTIYSVTGTMQVMDK